MFIYRLLSYISTISVTICVIIMGYYLFDAIKSILKNKGFSYIVWIEAIRDEIQSFAGKRTKLLLVISLVATIVTNTAVHQLVGIHNLLLTPDGTYCFYVEAHRNSGKSYALPAEIRIETETREVSADKERTYRYYYIEKIFFANGGWLEIENHTPVDINESFLYYDCDTDDEWNLVLLNEHAYSPYVTETNNADWLDITFMLLNILPMSFLIYVLSRKEDAED